jgi:hypothetical protein
MHGVAIEPIIGRQADLRERIRASASLRAVSRASVTRPSSTETIVRASPAERPS